MDRNWIANRTGRTAGDFAVNDPKGVFESGLGITSIERKEDEIANLVKEAPIHRWLSNRSFETFYDDLWQKSRQFNCRIENLREKP
jgi:hypothetical protein